MLGHCVGESELEPQLLEDTDGETDAVRHKDVLNEGELLCVNVPLADKVSDTVAVPHGDGKEEEQCVGDGEALAHDDALADAELETRELPLTDSEGVRDTVTLPDKLTVSELETVTDGDGE